MSPPQSWLPLTAWGSINRRTTNESIAASMYMHWHICWGMPTGPWGLLLIGLISDATAQSKSATTQNTVAVAAQVTTLDGLRWTVVTWAWLFWRLLRLLLLAWYSTLLTYCCPVYGAPGSSWYKFYFVHATSSKAKQETLRVSERKKKICYHTTRGHCTLTIFNATSVTGVLVKNLCAYTTPIAHTLH